MKKSAPLTYNFSWVCLRVTLGLDIDEHEKVLIKHIQTALI